MIDDPKSAAEVLDHLEEAIGDLNPTMEQAKEIWEILSPIPDFETPRLTLAVMAWERGESFSRMFEAASAFLSVSTTTGPERDALIALVEPIREAVAEREVRRLSALTATGGGTKDGE